MAAQQSRTPVTRRTALAGLGVGGIGLAASASPGRAEETPDDLSDHPLYGSWLITTPDGVAPAQFSADGSALVAWPIQQLGLGETAVHATSAVGTWERAGWRRGYFHIVQVLSDINGVIIGTYDIQALPVVHEDWKTFHDDGTRIRIYVRDASNQLISVLGMNGDLLSLTGVRMKPGSPGFPGPTGSPAEQ